MAPTTLAQDYTCPWKAQRYLGFIYTVDGITPAGELDFHVLTSLTAMSLLCFLPTLEVASDLLLAAVVLFLFCFEPGSHTEAHGTHYVTGLLQPPNCWNCRHETLCHV